MTSRDGNGWVRCDLGHRHWGRFGAAGLLAFVSDGGPVLLQQRTWWSHHGGTWGLPGGARDSHETVLAAALREAREECGVEPDLVRPRAVFTDDHGGWSYTTVLAQAETAFAVESDYDETADVDWVEPAKVTQLSLHPGFAEHWPRLRDALEPRTVIVDGANVVGSRPDGWWHDRVGAARRLRDQLIPLTGGLSWPGSGDAGASGKPGGNGGSGHGGSGNGGSGSGNGGSGSGNGGSGSGNGGSGSRNGGFGRRQAPLLWMTWLPDIVLVVEGKARAAADADGAEPGDVARGDDGAGRVRVIAAPGSGDDTIAELAAATAGRRIVVTADRELRQRCTAAGAEVAGPGWLLRQLEQ